MFELSIFWFNSYLINHLLLNLASIVQVNKVQFDRILGFINQGKEQGAKLVAGKNTIQAGFAVLFPYIWQFHDDLVWFDEIWYDVKWFDLFNKKVVVGGGRLRVIILTCLKVGRELEILDILFNQLCLRRYANIKETVSEISRVTTVPLKPLSNQ